VNPDQLYDTFENYYSESADETYDYDFRPSGKEQRVYFELRPMGIVMTHIDNLRSKNADNIEMVDFKVDIFNSYKNLYSEQFCM